MTRSLTLSIFRASEAAKVTGMTAADQRNKRTRRQLSAIEPGKQAALTVYDLGEIALVQQFAALKLASEGVVCQRREAARVIGYWALRFPGAIEGGKISDAEIAAAGVAHYPIPDINTVPNVESMPLFFLWYWRSKNGVNTFSLDILAREDQHPHRTVTDRGPFIVFPLRQIGETLAAKAGRPLAKVDG